MVKSETCRVAKILVKNPSARLLDKKFRYSRKVTIKPCKNVTLRLVKNIFEILPNFPRPTFFEVTFATPTREYKFIICFCLSAVLSVSFEVGVSLLL